MMHKSVSQKEILEPMAHKRNQKRLVAILSGFKDIVDPQISNADKSLNREMEKVFGLICDISRVKRGSFDKKSIRRFHYYAQKCDICTACHINATTMLRYRLFLELCGIDKAKEIFENVSLANVNDFSKALVERNESFARGYLHDAFFYTMHLAIGLGGTYCDKSMARLSSRFNIFRDIVNSPAYTVEDSPIFDTPKRYGNWIWLDQTKRFEGDMGRYGADQEEYHCCSMLDYEISKRLRMQTLSHISQVEYAPVGFFVKREDEKRSFRFVCLEIDLIRDGDILEKAKVLRHIGLPVQTPLGYRYIKGRLIAGLSYIRGDDLRSLMETKIGNENIIFEKIGYMAQKAHMNGVLFGDLATRNIIIADKETRYPKIHLIDYEHVSINEHRTPFAHELREEDLQEIYSEMTGAQRDSFEKGRNRFEKRGKKQAL